MENPFARAMLAGTFHPGDIVVADADPVSGTLVFRAEDRAVVTNPSARRDARSPGGGDPAGAGGSGARSAFDLPPLAERKGPGDDDLIN